MSLIEGSIEVMFQFFHLGRLYKPCVYLNTAAAWNGVRNCASFMVPTLTVIPSDKFVISRSLQILYAISSIAFLPVSKLFPA